MRVREPASFWRGNVIAVFIVVVAETSESNVRSFIILRLGEGLTSFNKNYRVNFCGVYFLRILKKKSMSNLVLVVVFVLESKGLYLLKSRMVEFPLQLTVISRFEWLAFFLSWLLCAFSFLPFHTDNTLTWLELSLAMAPGFLEFPFVQTTRTSFQGMLCFPFLRFLAFFSWSACANIASPVTSYCELSPVKPPLLRGRKLLTHPLL